MNGCAPRTWLAALLFVALLGPARVSAQVVTDASWAHGATLSGVMVDETQAAIPGVRITALNTDTGTLREARSGGDGWFLMPLLPAGDYVLTAEQDGFAPLEIRGVRLRSSDHLALRIPLRIRGISQSVTVEGSFSALDLDARILPPAVGQWVQGVRVGGELQRRLPLSPDRGFADIVALAPGVVFQSSGHFVHGVSGDAAVVLVDGADLSSTLAGNPERLRLGLEAIEAVEVRTAGIDASIPLSQGAVISVVTKSGTNQLRGAVGAQIGTRGMMAHSPDRPRSGRAESDVAIGGPVLRDRWWFFGGDRATAIRTDAVVPLRVADTLRALVPGWQPEQGSDGWNVFFVKQTARISPRQDVTAFYQRDTREATLLYSNSAGTLPRMLAGGSAYSARWAGVWSDALMTRASVSYNDKTNGSQVRTETSGPAVTVYRSVRPSAGLLQGEAPLGQINMAADCCWTHPARKLTLSGDLTWYRRGWGSHELQAGLFLQPYLRYRRTEEFRGLVYEEAVLREPLNLSGGFIPFRRQYFDGPPVVVQDFRGQDEAVYLQDTWRPASWLTVGAGLRADWIQDREHTTDLTSRRTWAIGPRLSLAVAPTPRDTFRAGWGRIHESPAASRIATGASVGRNPRVEYDLDLDGAFETVIQPRPTGLIGKSGMDLERGQPYVNELTLGYRRHLPAEFVFDLGFVARGYHDIPLLWSGSTYRDGDRLINIFSSVGVITANTWNHPVVTDLTAQVTRQTARLQVTASYNRNWRHVEGTWLPDDPAAILQPSAFANNRGLGSVNHGEANSLSGYADTATDGWVDHSAVIAGTYIASSGVTVAAMYRLQSGLWSGPVTTMIPEPEPGFPAYLVVLPGLNIPNPLGTTVRFAYPTRGDGQLRLPTVHTLALRVGFRRSTRWGRIEPALDVFNPMNWDTRVAWTWGANQQYNPSYGRAGDRQAPRSVVASVRVVF